jgi:iron-sulfur cluster repair protein YtfE (RIC family)
VHRSQWDAYPRNHPYSTGLAKHFVEHVHGHFRSHFRNLTALCDPQRGTITAESFQRTILPPLLRVAAELHQHHRLEDSVFFPQLKSANPGLVSQFCELEKDHDMLHALEEVAVSTASPLEDRIAAVVELGSFLENHLQREEMIVVPLLIQEGAH